MMNGTLPGRAALLPMFLLIASIALPCAAWSADDLHALRVRRDDARDRTWVLNTDGVYLIEHRGTRSARRFHLPGWMHVVFPLACDPDLLIEPGGTVIVSSNVVSSLWRIDPEASSVTELAMVLVPDRERDIGFTALRLSDRGALLARGTTGHSRWQLDLQAGTAFQLTR